MKEKTVSLWSVKYGRKVVQRFMSVDPLAESYAGWSPYNYVLNNPISFTDPDGRSVDTEIFNNKGKKIGEDQNGNDGNVAIVNKKVAKQLKKGEINETEAISSGLQTTKAVLEESLDVLKRTFDNGGLQEEVSVVEPDGNVTRGETGPSFIKGGLKSANVPVVEGDDNTLIHSHITGKEELFGKKYGSDASKPSETDYGTFTGFKQNVIVGKIGPPKTKDGESVSRPAGIVIFNREGQKQGAVSTETARKILKK